MNRQERYLCEAGYPRAVWRPPADPEHRRVWEQWLKGLLVTIASCVALALFLGKDYGPQDTTAQMEHIAKQLEKMDHAAPQTVQAIQDLMSKPGYDCERVACGAALKQRNRAVRARLRTLLAARATGQSARY